MQTDLYFLIAALLALIPVSGAIRIVICLIKINTDPDQEQLYKTRAKHTLLFIIIALCAEGVLMTVWSYLS